MKKIKWTAIEITGKEFEFEGRTFAYREFQPLRSLPWGDAPNAPWLRSQRVDGWLPRGAGNDDPYVYVIKLDNVFDEEVIKVALIDTREMDGEGRPTIETTITSMKRLMNSKNGNPRWEVSTPMGTWQTKPDATDASLLSESIVGRKCRITLENNLIKYIAVWTEFPDGTSEWYGQQS